MDPLVSLMMVEKVPDSTYEMIGGLDKQIREIKEVIELPVKHPELFEALGIAQPKVSTSKSMCLTQCDVLFRACFYMDLRELEKRCWLAPSPITPSVRLFECRARSSCRNSLVKARAWCASCSSWPGEYSNSFFIGCTQTTFRFFPFWEGFSRIDMFYCFVSLFKCIMAFVSI